MWYFLHFIQILQVIKLWSAAVTISIRCPQIKVKLHKGVQELFCTHAVSVWFTQAFTVKKLLCQHVVFIGKVTVSSGRGLDVGREEIWMMDWGLHERAEGGMQSLWYPVGTRETSTTAVAAVHVILKLISQAFTSLSLLLLTQTILQGNASISYPLSLTRVVYDHPPFFCPLPVANSIMKCWSDRSCFSWLHTQWHVQDIHTRKRSLYIENVYSAGRCLHMQISVSLYSVYMDLP